MVTPGTIKQIELTQSVNDEKPIKITKERSWFILEDKNHSEGLFIPKEIRTLK